MVLARARRPTDPQRSNPFKGDPIPVEDPTSRPSQVRLDSMAVLTEHKLIHGYTPTLRDMKEASAYLREAVEECRQLRADLEFYKTASEVTPEQRAKDNFERLQARLEHLEADMNTRMNQVEDSLSLIKDRLRSV